MSGNKKLINTRIDYQGWSYDHTLSRTGFTPGGRAEVDKEVVLFHPRNPVVYPPGPSTPYKAETVGWFTRSPSGTQYQCPNGVAVTSYGITESFGKGIYLADSPRIPVFLTTGHANTISTRNTIAYGPPGSGEQRVIHDLFDKCHIPPRYDYGKTEKMWSPVNAPFCCPKGTTWAMIKADFRVQGASWPLDGTGDMVSSELEDLKQLDRPYPGALRLSNVHCCGGQAPPRLEGRFVPEVTDMTWGRFTKYRWEPPTPGEKWTAVSRAVALYKANCHGPSFSGLNGSKGKDFLSKAVRQDKDYTPQEQWVDLSRSATKEATWGSGGFLGRWQDNGSNQLDGGVQLVHEAGVAPYAYDAAFDGGAAGAPGVGLAEDADGASASVEDGDVAGGLPLLEGPAAATSGFATDHSLPLL